MLSFKGEQFQDKGMTDIEKLERDLRLHKELSQNYELITKLAIISLKRNIPMVFENPYTEQHYLTRYWAIKPSVIDKNRQERGDYFKKPTQYWFFNFEPQNNLILEPLNMNGIGSLWNSSQSGDFSITGAKNRTVARSMIHPQYANRFIREFILESDNNIDSLNNLWGFNPYQE